MGSNWSAAIRQLSEPDDRDQPDPQREREELREQRWTAFVAWLREQGRTAGWWEVLDRIASGYSEAVRFDSPSIYPSEQPYVDFAQAEGWPAVLSALSRAMAEQEAEMQEVERRR